MPRSLSTISKQTGRHFEQEFDEFFFNRERAECKTSKFLVQCRLLTFVYVQAQWLRDSDKNILR